MTSAIAAEEMLSSSPPPSEPVVSFSEIQVAAPLAANATGRIRPLMVNLEECMDQNSYRQPAFMKPKPSKRGPRTRPERFGNWIPGRSTWCSFACILCKAKLFSNKKALIDHQLQSHNNPKELDTLMRAAKTGSTFCCPFCEEFSHDLLAGIRRHVQRAHLPGIKFFKLTDSSKSLNVTVVNAQTWGQYPCQFCPYRFPKPADLLQHLDNFHADSVPRLSPPAVTTSYYNWPCPTCERPYNTQKSLSMHVTRSHCGDNAVDEKIKWHNSLGIGYYKCPYCPLVCSASLKIVCCHIKATHGESKQEQTTEEGVQLDAESSYKCERCDKLFRWPGVLLEHIEKTHSTSVKLEDGDSLSLEQLNKLC